MKTRSTKPKQATKKGGGILSTMRFMVKNKNYFKAAKRLDEIKMLLVRANVILGKLGYHDEQFAARVLEFDRAMIELSKAKWFTSKASATRSREDWAKAFQSLKEGERIARQLNLLLGSGSRELIPYEKPEISSHGTEITFADGVPLLPEICPLVILQGSDYEMGYQYAQQVIQIFGTWIFERKAGLYREFSPAQMACLHKWEDQIRMYAPEILELCRGWAQGAVDAGVSMCYEDVLDLWTGHVPPTKNYMGFGEGLPAQLPQLACSGAAAWGRASSDGRLVTGSSGDHDCTHMVTVLAFPKTGNNFIITPFSVTGDVREIGTVYMMGHPGMNNKGLAYVEHGGGPKMVEPKKYWGYGLRLGTAVFHILRFANNAKEAQAMELSYPIGDAGRPMGYVGGFWADSTYGYSIESRKDPIIIREAGVMGEVDFLYANNSVMHPGAGVAGWMQRNKDNWCWHPNGGWYPTKFLTLTLANLFKMTTDDRVTSGLSYAYENSRRRNEYMYSMMSQAIGRIDLDYMKLIYRKSGSFPPGNWKEIKSAYNREGKWGDYSTGQATNACVAVMKPDAGDQGVYAICIGPAARGLTPNTPLRAAPIYKETNAFWEIKLGSSPKAVTEYVQEKARQLIERARHELSNVQPGETPPSPLNDLLAQAQCEFRNGVQILESAGNPRDSDALYNTAKAGRAFTRAQVRALQVIQAIVPPPSEHGDFVESS